MQIDYLAKRHILHNTFRLYNNYYNSLYKDLDNLDTFDENFFCDYNKLDKIFMNVTFTGVENFDKTLYESLESEFIEFEKKYKNIYEK